MADAVNLEEAEIIVAGGRGVGSADNFRLIQELAEVLGAKVGCSRAVVDAGWLSHIHQVGQSGKTVTPRLYVAVGISGAIQHLAGIAGAEKVLAVNKDPEAPIFSDRRRPQRRGSRADHRLPQAHEPRQTISSAAGGANNSSK